MKRSHFACMIALLILACSGCGRREAHNQARAVPPPTEASSYEFLGSVLSSLARAHGGVVMIRSVSDPKNLVDMMTAGQNAAVEIQMAASELRPFSTSRNENRREAVGDIVSAYAMIGQSLAIQLAAYERMDSAEITQDVSRLVGLRKRASDAKVAYQQGSSLLATATAIAFLSTMVPDHGDTNRTALDLTDGERLQLIARGDSLFGAALTDRHESGPAAAAQILVTGLNKQRSGR